MEPLLGRLRSDLIHDFKLIDEQKESLLWVTDFPLFSQDEEESWHSVHHPFTAPQEEKALESFLNAPSPEKIPLAQAYDLVYNGNEIAGGSLRIHHATLQRKIFEFLGLSPEMAEARFGFFIKALQYGCPPHGGMAWGLDRLVMLLCGEKSLREVIAFPKTSQACTMSGCPSPVDWEQLNELGLRYQLSLSQEEQKETKDFLCKEFKSELSKSPNTKDIKDWVRLSGTNLTGIEVNGTKFVIDKGCPLHLKGKALENWYFVNMDLSESNFKNATFKNCHFISCDLQQTTFQDAILENCNFINVRLQSVNFKMAKLFPVNLPHFPYSEPKAIST